MVTRTSFRARVLNLTIVTASSKSARSPDRAHTGTDCQCALLLRTPSQWQLEHTDSDTHAASGITAASEPERRCWPVASSRFEN